ncbi:helix-turn-helix transcriptional regulator [Patescibacteria group bacterium]|nr:helix-turn-helix transcriptional regulator [Patescibacteria group bacterium]
MDTKKLGKKIKLAPVELDLTQTQLAQKINSKQKSISHYETGASVRIEKEDYRICPLL